MLGKRVRVFWPLDSQWYVGVVQEYDPESGEHKLRYPDGDTEWVKIGDTQQGMNLDGDKSSDEADDEDNHKAGALPDSPRGGSGYPPPLQGGLHGGYGPPVGYPGYPPYHMPPEMGPPHKESRNKHEAQKEQLDHSYSPQHPAAYGGYPPYGMHGYGPPPGYGMPPRGVPPGYPHYPDPYAHPMVSHHAPPGYPPYPPGPQIQHTIKPEAPTSQHQRASPPSKVESRDKAGGSTTGSVASSTGGIKRKNGPKTWTKEEDMTLLRLVQSMRGPMKWSVVAQSMPERTGKQCRERYVNHLNPRLKVTDWSPMEDATIFHLYDSLGSQWAKMAKMIPGRTDNGIKNRFHNLRRQLEREDEHRLKLSKSDDFPDEIYLDRVREFPAQLKGKSASLWNMNAGIGILSAQSVLGVGLAARDQSKKKFGPFRAPGKEGEYCARCGLIVPSVQCGPEICSRSKWCLSCTRIPSHLCGSLLRECLNLRRAQDEELENMLEAWTLSKKK